MKKKETLINEYLEHECALMLEDLTIKTLEMEIRQRKIACSRLKGVVDKDKKKLKSTLSNEQSTPQTRRFRP